MMLSILPASIDFLSSDKGVCGQLHSQQIQLLQTGRRHNPERPAGAKLIKHPQFVAEDLVEVAGITCQRCKAIVHGYDANAFMGRSIDHANQMRRIATVNIIRSGAPEHSVDIDLSAWAFRYG